jgi:hypothetical protein
VSSGIDSAFNTGSTTNIGAADAALVSANVHRSCLIITNGHATQTLSLALGATAVADSGIRLQPNQSIVFEGDNLYRGAVRAIGSGANTNALVTEW